jgi:hypothetical protein
MLRVGIYRENRGDKKFKKLGLEGICNQINLPEKWAIASYTGLRFITVQLKVKQHKFTSLHPAKKWPAYVV